MRVLIVDDGLACDSGQRGPSRAERLAGELRCAGYAVELVGEDGAIGFRRRPTVLESAGIALDAARRRVSREGTPVELSGREFGVLEALMRADGAVVSGGELMARVWGVEPGVRSNAVRIAISRLRTKLGTPAVVETVPRAGYRLRL